MIQGGFYGSFLFCSIFDVKRKDFWEMLFHHLITMCLISFSWIVNFVRVGTLICIFHDICDVFLEFGKLIRYSKRYIWLRNVVFVIFLISWIVCRLIYFSIILVRSAIRDYTRFIQPDAEV
jgi:ceramide synthetase